MNEAVTAPGQTQAKRRKKKTQPSTGKRRRGPGIDFSTIVVSGAERPGGRGAPPKLSQAHLSVLETLGEPDGARKVALPPNTKAPIFVREFRRILKKHRPDVKLMSANIGKGEIKLWVVPVPFDGEFPAVAGGNGTQPASAEEPARS